MGNVPLPGGVSRISEALFGSDAPNGTRDDENVLGKESATALRGRCWGLFNQRTAALPGPPTLPWELAGGRKTCVCKPTDVQLGTIYGREKSEQTVISGKEEEIRNRGLGVARERNGM